MSQPSDESPATDRERITDLDRDVAKSTASLASAETIPPNRMASSPQQDAFGEYFDHYRLIKELGHGAMGTVYLAEDTKLRRLVALKRPRVAGSEEAAVLQRFYREAYSAATLNHPNICPVYDIGECNGVPYITMAYIEGRTLSQVIRDGKPLNPRAVAGLIRKLALALAEAHERGIVHRDLKPGNITLNQRSEPIVMDFGLARQLDADVEDRLTGDGMLVGTLAYMSPEQVEGDLARIGPPTDIYSLGVVLFELLTGKLPFTGSAGSVIRQIASVEPPAASSWREQVPQELNAICLRMMAKDANARYASMSEVAQTLTDYLKSNGEPASMAAPPPVDEILPAQLEARQKQIQRLLDAEQWREASLHLQRISSLTQPIAAPFVEWAREQETALHIRWQQEQESATRSAAEAKEDFARHDYVGAAHRLVKIDKHLLTVESKQLLDESIKLGEEVDLLIHLIEQGLSGGSRAGMFRNMQRLLQLKPRDPLVRDLYRKFRWQQRLGWIGATLADAFALTGISRMRTTIEEPMYRKWFALAALVFVSSFGLMSWYVAAYLRSAKQASVAHVSKGDVELALPTDRPAIAVAPFDAAAAARFQQAWAKHLGVPVEIENSIGIKMRLIPPGEFAMGLSESDLAALLLVAEKENNEWTETHLRAASPQHPVWLTEPYYIGTMEVTQAQWDAVMESTTAQDASLNDKLPAVNKSWDDIQEFLQRMNQRVGDEGRVYLLPTEAQWEFACLAGDQSIESDALGNVGAQAWHSDNSKGKVHAGGQLQPNDWGLFDMPGNVWEWCSDRFAEDYYGNSAREDPRGPTTSTSRTLRGGAWSHPPIECGRRFRIGGPPDHRDSDVGFRLAATLGTADDGRSSESHAAEGNAARFQPLVVEAAPTPLPDGPPGLVKLLPGHTEQIRDLAVSPDGRFVGSVSYDLTIRMWDLRAGKEFWTVTPGVRPTTVAFNPAGTQIIIGSSKYARIFDATNGTELHQLQQDTLIARRALFSPRGDMVATGSKDGVRIWEFDQSGRPIQTRTIPLKLSNAGPTGLAFTADGARLLVADASNGPDDPDPFGLRLIDIASATEIRRYRDATTGNLVESTGEAIAASLRGNLVAVKSHKFPGHGWDPVVLDIDTGEIVRHPHLVGTPAFSPDPRFLAVGDANKIAVCDEHGDTVWEETPQLHCCQRLVFTPDGRYLISGSGWYWDASGGQSDSEFPIHVWRMPQEIWPALSVPKPARDEGAKSITGGESSPKSSAPAATRPATPAPVTRPSPAPTRQKKVLITAGKSGGHAWHYSLTTPPTGWQVPETEDKWPTARSAFGTPERYGRSVRTRWIHSNIYMRTKVYIPRFDGRKMILHCMHDDGAEIYVNGMLLKKFGGYSGYFDYTLNPRELSLFRQDSFNDIAVHCRQNNASVRKGDTGNPQVIDLGLRLE